MFTNPTISCHEQPFKEGLSVPVLRKIVEIWDDDEEEVVVVEDYERYFVETTIIYMISSERFVPNTVRVYIYFYGIVKNPTALIR